MEQRNKGSRREQELKDQRRKQKKTAILLIVLVAVVCAGGIGYSVYDKHQKEQADKEASKQEQQQLQESKQNTGEDTVNVDPLLDYLSGLDTELLNEEIAPVSENAVSGQ